MKTLLLPQFNVDRHVVGRILIDGTLPFQQNVARLKQDVAWVGATTTTTWAQETRRNHTQTTLRLPR